MRGSDGADENTYVRDQNARVDPLFTIGTLTVADVREMLADLPDDAVVVVAGPDGEGEDCTALADIQECWYFPRSGDYAPIGRETSADASRRPK